MSSGYIYAVNSLFRELKRNINHLFTTKVLYQIVNKY